MMPKNALQLNPYTTNRRDTHDNSPDSGKPTRQGHMQLDE